MILPIHLLDTGDEGEFGKEYVRLSKLGRLGFPIASGFVVSPPLQEIKNFIIDNNVNSLLDFEIKKANLYQKLLGEPPLVHMADPEQRPHIGKYWPELVSEWVDQIHSNFIRFGEFSPKHFHLKSLPIFSPSKVQVSGVAVWDDLHNRVHIKPDKGQLDPELTRLIDGLMIQAHQKLGVYYDYHFIVDPKLRFTRLSEANHEVARPAVLEIKQRLEKTKLKRAIRLYTNYSGNFVLDQAADGYFLQSEDFHSHDEKLMVLLETMAAKSPQPMLYKISRRFLKSDAAVVKYCRNLKKLDNLNLVFDGDQDIEQLMALKRDLAAEGVSRKGKMQFWVFVSLPSAVLRIDEILGIGFDGVMIDIDSIGALLYNRDLSDDAKKADLKALLTFLDPVIKNLNKQKIPVIFWGKLSSSEDLIEKAVKWGVYGLVVEAETDKIDEIMAFKERLLQFA